MNGESALSIFRRLIEAAPGNLSPGAAEAVLRLRFTDADQARLEELADKSNSGKLTSTDADEYDNYIAAADVLSLWKSKARISLNQRPAAV